MPETSSSSSASSCASSISFDEVPAVAPPGGGAVKFLCSYGGRILPRRVDGKLRYVGGQTRVLTVQPPLHFHGLYMKLRELCGRDGVSVRCQLPTEDMDALVSVTSDADIASVLDEYEYGVAANQQQHTRMIRVFLFLHAPPLACRERPGHALVRAGPPRAVRFVMSPPTAPVSPLPARPELFCCCQ